MFMKTQENWIARIDGVAIDVIEEKSGFGIVHIGTKQELEDCEYPLETAKANAKLIAAAPDLLSAIQYYFDVLKETQRDNWDKHPDHVLSKMLNAVKKVHDGK